VRGEGRECVDSVRGWWEWPFGEGGARCRRRREREEERERIRRGNWHERRACRSLCLEATEGHSQAIFSFIKIGITVISTI